MPAPYRGRIAPSPTGFLHLGHAATFLEAERRAKVNGGTLIFRADDLDRSRCREAFALASYEDLRWLGVEWDEGPDKGGNFGPYVQSERLRLYRESMELLLAEGWAYPCHCSRREVASALSAPHATDEEPLYSGTCRPRQPVSGMMFNESVNWRFRIPNEERLAFMDGRRGLQQAVAGVSFGDFLVWRKDGFPSYQLASAVDDARMEITEIVRGEDLITSTFRQMLVWRALGYAHPSFYHCPLLADSQGKRLAKRDAGLSLRTLRQDGVSPARVRALIQEKLSAGAD